MTFPLDTLVAEKTTEAATAAVKALDDQSLPVEPGQLHGVMSDIGFPICTQAGLLQGRMSYQIIFDRQLGPSKEGASDVVEHAVNWLFCEWGDQPLENGELMQLAAGTIAPDMDVAVKVAAKAIIFERRLVLFHEGSFIARDGKVFKKEDKPLTERDLASSISSFRSSIRNGATVFAEDIR